MIRSHQSPRETIGTTSIRRDQRGNIAGQCLLEMVCDRLGIDRLPGWAAPNYYERVASLREALLAAGVARFIGGADNFITGAYLGLPARRDAIARIVGLPTDYLWPNPTKRWNGIGPTKRGDVEHPEATFSADHIWSADASERLRRAIKLCGKQPELPGRIGISRSTLYRWMMGADPGREHLAKLAKAVDVTPDWILHGGSPDSPTPIPEALAPALATARSFAVAIDALPVGKDIRTRLRDHLDRHIAVLEALCS